MSTIRRLWFASSLPRLSVSARAMRPSGPLLRTDISDEQIKADYAAYKSNDTLEVSQGMMPDPDANTHIRPTPFRPPTTPRVSDAERAGHAQLKQPSNEEEKWWPEPEGSIVHGRVESLGYQRKPLFDGMMVPEVKEVPNPEAPERISADLDTFMASGPALPAKHDPVFDQTRRWVSPPTFDPAIDDIEIADHDDPEMVTEIMDAVAADRKRLEAFSNPMRVEDEVDYLLQPNRQGQQEMAQRDEFNGFVHWGLIQAAHMAIEDQKDFAKAHECVNRYLRDIDLFAAWLKHPKITGHMTKKFGIKAIDTKFDKLMGMVMAMYTRGKIQSYECDHGGALRSLTSCASLISEGGDMKNKRHRKMLGSTLSARGMVLCKLKSYERAEDDLTQALNYLPDNRSATLYQIRAEVRENLGRIEEAREDEERAAEIWESADVIRTGLEGEAKKFVV